MNVTVEGALRFRSVPALSRALDAFDGEAYPEFFKSELWKIEGTCAFASTTFEIEPDCDHTRAFVVMANLASDGRIDLREGKSKEFTRIVRIGRPVNRWAKMGSCLAGFGTAPAEFRAAWAEHLADKPKPSRSIKPPRSIHPSRKKPSGDASAATIALPTKPRSVNILRDGSFAVTSGSKVYFIAQDGEITATADTNVTSFDQFGTVGISTLTELEDDRLVADCELTDVLRVIDRKGGVTEWKPAGSPRTECVQGVIAYKGGFVAFTGQGILQVDPDLKGVREHRHKEDYVRGITPYQGGLLAWTLSDSFLFDDTGKEVFRAKGAEPLLLPGGGLCLTADRHQIILDAEHREVATIDVGNFATRFFEGDDLIVLWSFPSTIARFSPSGELRWKKTQIHACSPKGLTRVGSLAVTYAPPPHVRAGDTTIGVFDLTTGDEVARLDAKADVVEVIALGDDGIAARVDGRLTGAVVHVWRKLRDKPLHRMHKGHKGRVRGIRVLEGGRLLSWAEDGLRFWA